MRTVSGPTDRVVVVGAGLGGLSAALRLAGAGRQVTVLERGDHPGGRAGLHEVHGYRFDTGPTVLTMPELLDDAFAAVGESTGDWLALQRLDPAYRAFFPDGSHLDVRSDVDAMAAAVANLAGAREADGYRRFAAFAQQLFELERHDFIDRNLDSPLALLTPQLARLAATGAFRRMAPKVATFFGDPRLRRVFSFQALYAGLSPYDALALYCSIAYLDAIAGVFYPEGGMAAVPQALAAAAAKHDVTVRYGTQVTRVELSGERAVAVHTRDGERVPCDVVVLNPDLPAAWELLPGGLPRRLARLRVAPSCLLLHLGVRATYGKVAHHNLHFGAAWRRSLQELARGELMSDPSLLVTAPSGVDPTAAPAGASALYALLLVPNLEAGIDWRREAPRARDALVARLEQEGYVGLGDAIEVELLVAPPDWARQGLHAGSPFGPAHTFGQTGPFRPGNLAFDNVVFVGAGTRPGIGVPMVLISGRLAAERVLGPGVR